MNFSEQEIIQKEMDLFSHRTKFINRLRMDAFFINLILVLGLLAVVCACMTGAVKGIFDDASFIGDAQLLSAGEPAWVYDKDGNEMQKLDGSGSRQSYISSGQMSDAVKNAFVAAEDSRFYEHRGFDIRGEIISLFGDNAGSEYEKYNNTLTQKLLRNQIFKNKNTASVFRKISQSVQEKYMAVTMENKMGKEKILEYYLNTVSFGNNILGIQQAALYYFDKSAGELTNSEAAVLAAMARDPKRYEPVGRQAENAVQRAVVLEKMLNMGCISEEEYEEALGDDVYIELQGAREKHPGKSEADSYYVDAVISQVIDDLKEKCNYSQTRAYQAVYHSGLKIYTCQDREIQKICDAQIKKEKKQQVSFVLLDQETGYVKALAGGRSGAKVQIGRNRAVDFTREPGNTLSLLSTWLPALDTAGMTLGSVVDDSAYEYEARGQIQKEKRSFGYHGLVTMRQSILHAITIPAIKTLERINIRTGYDYLQNLGFSTLVDKTENADGTVDMDADLSLAEGKLIRGVNNLELTAAYAAIANGGKYRKPIFYTKIVDGDGNILLENKTEEKTVIKESTAWLLSNVMQQMVSEGAAKGASFGDGGMSVAGMTGASSEKSDYWMEGFTPYFTAGIWSGTDNGSMAESDSSYLAVWQGIMEQVHRVKHLKPASFTVPSDIVERRICTKCGNLAVEGLCGEALGGNASRKEYFARGSEPDRKCNCHVKYHICRDSGKPANERCPKKRVVSRVFLVKEEMQDTEDTPCILPKDFPETACEIH